MLRLGKRAAALGAAVALVLGPAACGNGDDPDGAQGGTGKGLKVGLLLPENKTARYEKFDKPFFEQKLKDLCPKCEVQYANAQAQAGTQQQQAEAMFGNGVNVLVLDAVAPEAAAAIVASAKAKNIPVVAYDRLAEGPVTSYVAYDADAVGRLQATAQAAGLTPVPAAAAGQDAELAGIQRIVAGGQYMAVFKPYKPEAETAAEMAVAAAQGRKFAGATQKRNNGTLDVDSDLLAPVQVTKANIKDTVAKPPYYTADEICTRDYAAACKAAGLT
jgi:ABC-type xylose transport system substrate-binding protein